MKKTKPTPPSIRRKLFPPFGPKMIAEIIFLILLVYLNIVTWQLLIGEPVQADQENIPVFVGYTPKEIGSPEQELRNPQGVSIDAESNIYVADTENNRMVVLSPEGNFLSSFGDNDREGRGLRVLSKPTGVALNSIGHIYVADTGNNLIQVFDKSGSFQFNFGDSGNGDGQFLSPMGIAIDSLDNVYVADTGNNRIQVFDANGRFLFAWGREGRGDGEFFSPRGVAVRGNLVFVVDTGNNRIQKFDINGQFIVAWGEEGKDAGQFLEPQGIALDSQRLVYITDAGNNRIKIYGPNGQLINILDNFVFKDAPRGFNKPQGVAIDSTNHIYLTDPTYILVFAYASSAPVTPGGGNGERPDSEGGDVTVMPNIPIDLKAEATSDGLRLTWTDTSDNEEDFIIGFSEDGQRYTSITGLGANISSGLISNLTPNTSYYVNVAAYNSAGTSDYVSFGPIYTLADAPTSVRDLEKNENSISIAWDGNATRYYIEDTTNNTVSDWIEEKSYSFSSLKCGTEYSFRVKGKNGDDLETEWSLLNVKTTDCVVSKDVPPIDQPAIVSEPVITSRRVEAVSSPSVLRAPVISSNPVELVSYKDPSSGAIKYRLHFRDVANVSRVAVANNSNFEKAVWQTYSQDKDIILSGKFEKIIYIKFLSSDGLESKIIEIAAPALSNSEVQVVASPSKSIISNIVSSVANFIGSLISPDITKPTEINTSIKPVEVKTMAGSQVKTADTAAVSKEVNNTSKMALSPGSSETNSVSPSTRTGVSITTPIAAVGPSLKVGSSGNEIKNVQALLKDLGYYTYPKITGYFGPVTETALKKFQQDQGLPAVGVLGPLTRKALEKASK